MSFLSFICTFVGKLNIGDIVRCTKPPFEEPECKKIKASRVFVTGQYYIILGFWYNDREVCSLMSCYGEIFWIKTRYLKIISRV